MTKIEKSSGNVFKDLGYKDPEETLAKAKIAIKIIETIKKRRYTHLNALDHKKEKDRYTKLLNENKITVDNIKDYKRHIHYIRIRYPSKKNDKSAEIIAKMILKSYGFKIEEKWKHHKQVWHVWHAGNLMWSLSYTEYIDRIIEIFTNKDKNQHRKRYKLIKPVIKPDGTPYTASYPSREKQSRLHKTKYNPCRCKWNKMMGCIPLETLITQKDG